jgi:hypothetical protein
LDRKDLEREIDSGMQRHPAQREHRGDEQDLLASAPSFGSEITPESYCDSAEKHAGEPERA